MASFPKSLALAAFAAVMLTACATFDDRPAGAASTRAAANIVWAPNTAWDRLGDLPWPQGGQFKYQSYDEARRIFWKKLYPNGGTELYCGIAFDGARNDSVNQALSVEHAYPADSIAETEPGCTNRSCSVPRVARAMADLQNLWPAFQRVNSSRSKLRFGEIPGEASRRFTEFCPDFERPTGAKAVVEPRDDVKGDLARTIVYMHFVYGLPLENAVSDKNLLLTWMQADPPDAEEMRRNALIDQLQGTPNPLLLDAFMGM
ncbi:MAG: endonuclease [Alphaproteobacteria bacterium]|nr:endonuclease [Alphaproteobacteria bacterium]